MRIKGSVAALWTACAVLLAACGSSDDPPPTPTTVPAAPVVTLAYGIKQLRFSWPAVVGATHYRLLERPDATAAFGQVGADITSTSVNHDIALHRRVNAAYRIEACNGVGCTGSQEIVLAANLLPAIGYLKGSNTEAGDELSAVALSADGLTLAVSATDEDSSATGVNGNQLDNSATSAGAVYVFTRSAGAWSQQAYIKASNTEAGDRFGSSLALSADGATLAATARYEDSSAIGVNGNQLDNSAPSAGAVYVFTRSAGAWSQQAYIKASNAGSGDQFGFAVALSSDGATLAASAPYEDSSSTGINGNQADNSASRTGAVYVFTRSAGTWSQQAYVKSSNAEANDDFGSTLALSADGASLAVGAPGEQSSATGVGGNQLDNSANQAGAVYVFTRTAGTWSQQAYLKASNTGAQHFFGDAVALGADGATLAVGATDEGSSATGVGGSQASTGSGGAGAAYVFTRNSGAWAQQAYVKASNTSANAEFGGAIALSADGATLAISAYGDASDAGAVYLY